MRLRRNNPRRRIFHRLFKKFRIHQAAEQLSGIPVEIHRHPLFQILQDFPEAGTSVQAMHVQMSEIFTSGKSPGSHIGKIAVTRQFPKMKAIIKNITPQPPNRPWQIQFFQLAAANAW